MLATCTLGTIKSLRIKLFVYFCLYFANYPNIDIVYDFKQHSIKKSDLK